MSGWEEMQVKNIRDFFILFLFFSLMTYFVMFFKRQQDMLLPENYEKLSEPYKRIRIAYIDAARKRPDEFNKRLASFINKTRAGKRIVGFGGVDKYYD